MRAEQLIVPAVFLAAISQLLATMIAMSSAVRCQSKTGAAPPCAVPTSVPAAGAHGRRLG